MDKHRFTPLLIALGTIVGICIGTFYTSHFSGGRINIINTGSSKVGYLLQLIDNNYVDTVDMNTLVEDAMPQILSELDPHSSYFGRTNRWQALSMALAYSSQWKKTPSMSRPSFMEVQAKGLAFWLVTASSQQIQSPLSEWIRIL